MEEEAAAAAKPASKKAPAKPKPGSAISKDAEDVKSATKETEPDQDKPRLLSYDDDPSR